MLREPVPDPRTVIWLDQIRISEVEVDPRFVAEILERARTTSGERGHNVGGWRSGVDLDSWSRSYTTLRMISTAVTGLTEVQAKLQAWAVLHERGSYHDWHAHTGVAWRCSGVLYLTSGGAATLFRGDGAHLRVVPKAGMLIRFPSNVEHATEPHEEPEPRITIAFNVA